MNGSRTSTNPMSYPEGRVTIESRHQSSGSPQGKHIDNQDRLTRIYPCVNVEIIPLNRLVGQGFPQVRYRLRRE
jgi:hypothetical protein